MEASGPTQGTGAQQTPAGWYPDPKGGGGQRYWDGTRWTEQVQAPQQAPAPGPTTHGGPTPRPAVPQGEMVKDPRNDTLAVAGYIASLVPLIGLIIGLVLRSRRDPRGNTVLIVTAVVFVIYIAASAGSGGS